jgi:hypothetical protein
MAKSVPFAGIVSAQISEQIQDVKNFLSGGNASFVC